MQTAVPQLKTFDASKTSRVCLSLRTAALDRGRAVFHKKVVSIVHWVSVAQPMLRKRSLAATPEDIATCGVHRLKYS